VCHQAAEVIFAQAPFGEVYLNTLGGPKHKGNTQRHFKYVIESYHVDASSMRLELTILHGHWEIHGIREIYIFCYLEPSHSVIGLHAHALMKLQRTPPLGLVPVILEYLFYLNQKGTVTSRDSPIVA
jgi:hypothetical protein